MYGRRHSKLFTTVMFCGTPCTIHKLTKQSLSCHVELSWTLAHFLCIIWLKLSVVKYQKPSFLSHSPPPHIIGFNAEIETMCCRKQKKGKCCFLFTEKKVLFNWFFDWVCVRKSETNRAKYKKKYITLKLTNSKNNTSKNVVVFLIIQKFSQV